MSIPILKNYTPPSVLAKRWKLSERTLSRYRDQGLEWMLFRGEVWIHDPGAEKFIADRTAQHTAKKVKAAKARAKQRRHEHIEEASLT